MKIKFWNLSQNDFFSSNSLALNPSPNVTKDFLKNFDLIFANFDQKFPPKSKTCHQWFYKKIPFSLFRTTKKRKKEKKAELPASA